MPPTVSEVPAPPTTGPTQPRVPPSVTELLTAAVTALGGEQRDGQLAMATAVDTALRTGEHLAVQAGTGTGKSLAYLVPAIRHAVERDTTVVVSTATIALQRQLVDRDLPRLARNLTPLLHRAPTFAILKGRRNYLCLHKLHTGPTDEPDDAVLFDPFAASALGRQVARLTEWAGETDTGDRDELTPGVGDQAWRQVSVTARECLGSRCPVYGDCFAEKARTEAGQVDVVVTNHALLAIDALENGIVLPEHDLVVVDEAHDLVDRVTAVATAELTAGTVQAAARRCGRLMDQRVADRLAEAADGLSLALGEAPVGRWERLPEVVDTVLAGVRDGAAACRSLLGSSSDVGRRDDGDSATSRKLALALLDEVHDTAERLLAAFADPDQATRHDVVWLADEERRGLVLRVAPLAVGGLLRSTLFARSTVVLTSATLALGGQFDTLARQWGLPPSTAPSAPSAPSTASTAPSAASSAPSSAADQRAEPGADGLATEKTPPSDTSGPRWTGLDVGSPFNYERSAILYLARHLPVPGRDGLPPAYLTEIEQLVTAAGGRTLGLFSSMRAARQAADELRGRLSVPVLCQGEETTSALVAAFAADPATCLFGTLSLWQGVDVPGPSLQLVIVDRIPFPRPDDPLMAARQRAVDARGGSGFMAVAASHAALRLAQGAGRLVRSLADRGVVAVLDPRLATARYGQFLRASLPPFWQTSDPELVRAALRRIDT